MLDKIPTFNVSIEPEVTILEKILLFPSADYDFKSPTSNMLPELSQIKRRRSSCQLETMPEFRHAIIRAKKRVFILDQYLFKSERDDDSKARIEEILSLLPNALRAPDIRFLTSGLTDSVEEMIIDQLKKREIEIKNALKYQNGLNIQIQFTISTLFPYVHDRFAIIDEELWHFGATVGGLHRDVSAVSRGWNQKEYKAVEFFECAWLGDPDRRLVGKHK